MSNAELKQYINRNKTIDIEEYITIIKGKTASLFKAALEASAILANIDQEESKKFGELFGILFQINNDLKNDSVKNDKMNGINTAINILGIEKTLRLKDNYKEDIRELIRSLPNKVYADRLEDLTELL